MDKIHENVITAAGIHKKEPLNWRPICSNLLENVIMKISAIHSEI
jgi:hypothetical protein